MFVSKLICKSIRRVFSSTCIEVRKRSMLNMSEEKINRQQECKPFRGVFQYISDIHLDLNPFDRYEVKAISPYLVIAGDLGRISTDGDKIDQFFKDNCPNYEKVIYVPGNHEYHVGIDSKKYSKDELTDQLNELENRHTNLHVLNRKTLSLPSLNVTVLGCTLWSHIPYDEQIKTEKRISDFRYTYGRSTTNNLRTIDENNQDHLIDVTWLENEISLVKKVSEESKESCGKILVVTHHAPLIHDVCRKKFLYNPRTREFDRSYWCNYAYSSDQSKIIEQLPNGSTNTYYNNNAWIFGHTHYRTIIEKKCDPLLLEKGKYGSFFWYGSTFLVTNALGGVKKNTYQSLRSI